MTSTDPSPAASIHPPSIFIEKCLWTRSRLKSEPPSYRWSFDDDHISRVEDTISNAFASSASALVSDDPHPEKAVCLFAPFHGGATIIDAMVKVVAQKVGADVLVLDSLDLAAGRHGPLGEGGVFVDSVYKSLPLSDLSQTQDIQRAFDTVVRAGVESQEDLTRRIVYLRDFSSIQRASIPVMIFLLRAMEALRTTHSAIIVLGGSLPLGNCGNPDESSHVGPICTFTWKQRERAEGDELKESEFKLESKVLRRDDLPLDNLASTFFAPIFTQSAVSARDDQDDSTSSDSDSDDSSSSGDGNRKIESDAGQSLDLPVCEGEGGTEVHSRPSWWEQRAKSLVTPESCICVRPTDICSEYQRESLDERVSAVNRTLLALSLAQKSVCITDGINATELVNKSRSALSSSKGGVIEYSILHPSFVNKILGVIIRERPSSDSLIEIPASEFKVVFYKEVDQSASGSKSTQSHNSTSKSSANFARSDPVIEKVRKSGDLSSYERQMLHCIVETRDLSTSFTDVILDDKIKQGLRSIVSLPLLYPHHFSSGILAREAISGALLYGPPGTGKTMVCRALACESGARMLLIKPSDILEKYVGESEKLAEAVFRLAYRLAPCVVFIDEVDAIFGTRSSCGPRVLVSMLTEFMQAMDGLTSGASTSSKDKGVVVVAATNRPYDIDQAILRRLPCRMLVDLPEEREREEILRMHLNGEELDGVDLKRIAAKAKGYSGSDLKNLCVAAALAAVKESIGDAIFQPTKSAGEESSLSGATKRGSTGNGVGLSKDDKTSTQQEPLRVIKMDHFRCAFTQVSASSSPSSSSSLYDWHKKYGSNAEDLVKGGRRAKSPARRLWGRLTSKISRN
ncbi:hypothetical protein VNI00_010099 [Paramarasmius palmivorus]|uniref:AAA+ ATPase domain-containing protein n=1 Tax=Paramarasmius palmivorus TaxID=297713 RepID=A0AAW0CJT4_9AGAR